MTPDQKAAWLAARAGKLTASRMKDAMDFNKDGKPSKKRSDLLRELLAERCSDGSTSHFVTEAMQHGIDCEGEAVDKFVELTGRNVRLSRFYEHPRIKNFGATPDRELDDGLIEVKCPTTTKYLDWLIAGEVPDEHKPQMAAQLACTGKSWVGFLAYDPRIKDERKRLFMAKYTPTPEYIAEIEAAAERFLAELDAMEDAFREAA